MAGLHGEHRKELVTCRRESWKTNLDWERASQIEEMSSSWRIFLFHIGLELKASPVMIEGTILQFSILHGLIFSLLDGLRCSIALQTMNAVWNTPCRKRRAHRSQLIEPCFNLTSARMLLMRKPSGGTIFCVLISAGKRPPSTMRMYTCRLGQYQHRMLACPSV